MIRGITETVKHLLIINVLMFIGTLIVKNELFYKWFALYVPMNENFRPWQLFTHMFMHGGFMHIFFNMFALWMFGTAVEQRFGAKKFIFFYISCGLGAALVTIGVYYFKVYPNLMALSDAGIPQGFIKDAVNLNILDGNTFKGEILGQKMQPLFEQYNLNPSIMTDTLFRNIFELNYNTVSTMVGASGAIMGVLVAFGMLYPESQLMLIFLPIPIKAKYFIPGIIILDLISAVTGQSFFSPSNTAYAAHVGGALTGFLIMWYWKKTQFNKNRWDL